MVKSIYLKQIQMIIQNRLRDCKFQLFLFGSQTTQSFGRTSDIDVGILPITPIPLGLLSKIREELEESCVPYPVDLVDLSVVSSDFVRSVKEKGIKWDN